MIKDIKKQFPFFNKNKDISYLDSAASSITHGSVIDSLVEYYTNNGSNVHRGVYKLAYDATINFEETRKVVAKFINSNENEVIFTKGTTDGLNKIALSLSNFIEQGDEIITTELEHHSSVLPWRIVANKKDAIIKYVPLTNEGRITVDNFKKVLTNKTKVVAITDVSNSLGYQTPIDEIIKLAHSVGAIVILDVAQSISHKRIDVKKLDVDFIAFSAHKMYGPNGVGVIYGKETLLNKMPPFEYGGEMAHLVDKTSESWKDIPYKFEAGTPVIAEVIAFKEAIKFIESVGFNNIFKHEMNLKEYTYSKLKEIEGLTIYNHHAESPIIAFNLNDVHPHDVASILDDKGVCVRAGHHCAQLVTNFLGVNSTLRASFAIYNTKEDCDKLVDAVKYAKDFFGSF